MEKKLFVRTILGDINPKDMGITDAHEHFIKNGGPESHEHPDFIMLDLAAAKAELAAYVAAGGKTLITMDPPNIGRDVTLMLKLAKSMEGKAHIVMATGFHKAKFYDKYSSWLKICSIEEITDMMVAEIEVGMDLYNYSGPIVKRTPHKAGVIKCGTSYAVIDPLEVKELKIAAATYHRTGVPISVHTQLGTMALEVAEILLALKVPPTKIILCHINKNPDPYYYRKILELGVFLAFDGPDRVKYYPDSLLARNIAYLIKYGFQKQIMLAMDAGRVFYQTAYAKNRGFIANGIPYLLTRFVPTLKLVLAEEYNYSAVEIEAIIKDILIKNPQVAFAFDQIQK